MVAFASSPFVIKLRALSMILEPTPDQDHLRIGHGWDDQQQHLLTIVCDSWDLEVDLHESKVWDGCTPCPL